MATVSSIFWVLGFILSVVIAPQLRIWTWGPTMLCFGLAAATALPVLWKERSSKMDLCVLIAGFLLAAWITTRAIVSPVAELLQSDALLLAMAVATFISFRAISTRPAAERITILGIALLLAASLWMIARQIGDPTFSLVFPNSEPKRPAGFFAHYSYGASFLIAVSLLLGAVAIHSGKHAVLRIVLGILSVLGMVAVYYTKSRGGLIGMGAGFMTLLFLCILAGKQSGKKWFVPAIIAFPFLLIAGGVFFLNSLSEVQETRSGDSDLTGLLDNHIRLYLVSIALSCIAIHPFFGGGSRSFSWECFQFWDTEAMGKGGAKPEHVHNELLQTATDYGILGAGLLIVLIVMIFVSAAFRITSVHTPVSARFRNHWRIGGLAGFIGLFAQSNFEGIFRIPPGAILLALCLSAACLPVSREHTKSRSAWFSTGLISLSGIAAAIALALFGWKGSLVSRVLWASYFGPVAPGLETRADSLSEAIAIWPLGSLYHRRGMTYQTLAAKSSDGEVTKDFLRLAISDYETTGELHPLSPEPAINSATLLSALGEAEEAEAEFRRAIGLQGEMEAAFHAIRLYATHLHRKGLKQFAEKEFLSALTSLQLASKHIEKVAQLHGDYMDSKDERMLRVDIHESYGRALEEMGDFSAAMSEYDRTVMLPHGSSAHYRAGVLLGKRAVVAWSERRSEDALALFLMALDRTIRSRELPPGVTPGKKTEYVAYLKKTVKYLEGARVQPSKNPSF